MYNILVVDIRIAMTLFQMVYDMFILKEGMVPFSACTKIICNYLKYEEKNNLFDTPD